MVSQECHRSADAKKPKILIAGKQRQKDKRGSKNARPQRIEADARQDNLLRVNYMVGKRCQSPEGVVDRVERGIGTGI